jgi:acetyl-CoA C-acetyltransferase
VNSAQTRFAAAHPDQQHVDLITEAVTAVLRGTGLRMDDVDFVIDSGSDFLDGRSISNCGFLGAMGGDHKEESRVEEDGLWSLCYAADKIASGSASVGLVVAYSKPSESDVRSFWTGLLEPFTQRPTGLDHASAAGLTAQRYLERSGLKAEDLREVTQARWAAAERNPWVDTTSAEPEGHWEETVASPLRRVDLSRPMDGAVAVLLARGEVAGQATPRPVWITGQGAAIDEHHYAARASHSLPACTAAAERALEQAGVSGVRDLDLVEASATSSVGELMVLEALGVTEPYRGIRSLRDGAAVEVNPSGGALPADVIMASGLARLHEAAARLAGRPGFEDSTARTALAHGTGGFAMQNHCVVTMEAAS